MSQCARNYSEHSDSAQLRSWSSRCRLIAVQLETEVPGSPGPQDFDSGSMLVTVAPCWGGVRSLVCPPDLMCHAG